MKPFVITIAREYGSGGKTIGKRLAEELGVAYYDRELLRLASDESGINEQLFAGADEKLRSTLLFKTAKGAYTGELIPPESDDFVSNQNLFNFQAKVIRELAEKESCVIIGRCADYILKDMDNVLRIYVHAPFDFCVREAKRLHPSMGDEEVARYVRKTNRRRADYYQYYTGRNWKNADNYDLCLNSSALTWEQCIALVKAYLDIKLS